MRIDFTNKRIIESEEISINDFDITSFFYDQIGNKIYCIFRNDYIEKHYLITYSNVISVEIQSCNFLGDSFKVLNWKLGEKSKSKTTTKVAKLKNADYLKPQFEECDRLVETILTFYSGNTITILCEYIDFK